MQSDLSGETSAAASSVMYMSIEESAPPGCPLFAAEVAITDHTLPFSALSLSSVVISGLTFAALKPFISVVGSIS